MKSCMHIFMLLLILKCHKGVMELYKDGCAIDKIGSLTISNSFTISCDLNSPITAGVIIQTPGGKFGNCLVPVRSASFGCPSQMSQDISSGVTNWTVSAASTREHNGTWACTYHSTTFLTVVIIIYMDTDPVFSYTTQSKVFVNVGDQNYQTFTYTTGCMYPKPSFSWEYVNSRNNATLLTVSASASHTEDMTTDCSATNANAKVFKSTLIGKYEETLAGETAKLKVSITFQDDSQCFITELDKLSGEIEFQGPTTTEGETTSTEQPITSSIITTTLTDTPTVTVDSIAATTETTTLISDASTTISMTQRTKNTLKPTSEQFWTVEKTAIVAVSLVAGLFVIVFVFVIIIKFFVVRRQKYQLNDKQKHGASNKGHSYRRDYHGHGSNSRPKHDAVGHNHGHIARQNIYDNGRGNAEYHHPSGHKRSNDLDRHLPRILHGIDHYRFTKDNSPYTSVQLYVDYKPYEFYTGGISHGSRHDNKKQQRKQLDYRRNPQCNYIQPNYPAHPGYNNHYSYPYY